MDCEHIQENLLAYLDGEVSDAERVRIEVHLATCSGCAAELGRLQVLRSGLRQAMSAGMEHLRLSHAAEERIRARLRQARRARAQSPFDRLVNLLRPRPGLVKAAIPLVVILFLVATAFFSAQPTPVSAQETVVVAPETLAPDTDAALRVIVRHASSAQPIPGAEISVGLRPQGEREVTLYTGRTGQEGTADVRFHVPPYEQDDLVADLIITTSSTQGRDRVTRRVAVRRSFRVYLTSDKPLYQPGQTIHQRALALDAVGALPAAGRSVRFIVQGPNGERLDETSGVRASEYGIAASDYLLSPHAPHGTYRLIAALGDTISERTVTVGQYERPRFRVDLTTGQSYYLAREEVQGQVTARSFDGQGLPGARATLRAYLDAPERQLLATAEGRTDENGAFDFSFALPGPDLVGDRADLVLQAAVTDGTGNAEWAGRVLPIATAPLAIDVVAEGGRLRPGVENNVYILATAPDGMPVRARLDVVAAGERYELATDDYGLAQIAVTPAPAVEEMAVQVTAADASGRVATRTVTLAADRGPAQVLLRLDRAAYDVGETMQLEVLSGQGGTDVAYLDVTRRDGGQALGTYIARLRGGRALLAVDVSPEMAGTLELHAYQVLPDGTVVRDARLVVVDVPKEVEVSVQPDSATYRPGNVARVAIDTRVDGAPVQSAVGVAVVDESVFALEERAPGFAKLFFLLDEKIIFNLSYFPNNAFLKVHLYKLIILENLCCCLCVNYTRQTMFSA